MNAYKFIMAEEETVAARTIFQAIRYYCDLTGFEIDDFCDEDDIQEIPKNEWDTLMVKNTDGDLGDKEFYSLKELIEGLTEPELVCSTAY